MRLFLYSILLLLFVYYSFCLSSQFSFYPLFLHFSLSCFCFHNIFSFCLPLSLIFFSHLSKLFSIISLPLFFFFFSPICYFSNNSVVSIFLSLYFLHFLSHVLLSLSFPFPYLLYVYSIVYFFSFTIFHFSLSCLSMQSRFISFFSPQSLVYSQSLGTECNAELTIGPERS